MELQVNQTDLSNIKSVNQVLIAKINKAVDTYAYKPIKGLTNEQLKEYDDLLIEKENAINKPVKEQEEKRKELTRKLDDVKKIFTQQEKEMQLGLAKIKDKRIEIATELFNRKKKQEQEEAEALEKRNKELEKTRNDETFVNAEIIKRCDSMRDWFNDPARTKDDILRFKNIKTLNIPFEASDVLKEKYLNEVNAFKDELCKLTEQKIKDIDVGVHQEVDLQAVVNNNITEATELRVIQENIESVLQAKPAVDVSKVKEGHVYAPVYAKDWLPLLKAYTDQALVFNTPDELEKKFKFIKTWANNELKKGTLIEGVPLKQIIIPKK